jgi:hypothetical protein
VSTPAAKKRHMLQNTGRSLPEQVSIFLGRTFRGHHHDYSMFQQELPPEGDWFAAIQVRVD